MKPNAMNDRDPMHARASQSSDYPAVHLIVHGRVQGVGFRYFARVSAQRAGVVGWVRNREDGTVEVWAEGSEDRLKQFIQAVHRGPSHSHVTQVETTWELATARTPAAVRLRSFHIRD